MKQKIVAFNLIIGLCLTLTSCCKDSKTAALTKVDSLKITKSILKQLKTKPTLEKFYLDSVDEDKPISRDTVKKMSDAYDLIPAMDNDNLKPINMFVFNKKKWEALKGMTDVSQVAFRFGIRNYAQIDEIINGDDDIQAKYTLMVIPIGADNTLMLDRAFDFVCPCPSTASCCPKN